MSSEDPVRVVRAAEFIERRPQLLDRVEGSNPQQLLLEGSEEPLGASVALGRANEARTGDHAEHPQLRLEAVARKLTTVVVTQRDAVGCADIDAGEDLAHGVVERRHGLEASSPSYGVQREALARAVIDDGNLPPYLLSSGRTSWRSLSFAIIELRVSTVVSRSTFSIVQWINV